MNFRIWMWKVICGMTLRNDSNPNLTLNCVKFLQHPFCILLSVFYISAYYQHPIYSAYLLLTFNQTFWQVDYSASWLLTSVLLVWVWVLLWVGLLANCPPSRPHWASDTRILTLLSTQSHTLSYENKDHRANLCSLWKIFFMLGVAILAICPFSRTSPPRS